MQHLGSRKHIDKTRGDGGYPRGQGGRGGGLWDDYGSGWGEMEDMGNIGNRRNFGGSGGTGGFLDAGGNVSYPLPLMGLDSGGGYWSREGEVGRSSVKKGGTGRGALIDSGEIGGYADGSYLGYEGRLQYGGNQGYGLGRGRGRGQQSSDFRGSYQEASGSSGYQGYSNYDDYQDDDYGGFGADHSGYGRGYDASTADYGGYDLGRRDGRRGGDGGVKRALGGRGEGPKPLLPQPVPPPAGEYFQRQQLAKWALAPPPPPPLMGRGASLMGRPPGASLMGRGASLMGDAPSSDLDRFNGYHGNPRQQLGFNYNQQLSQSQSFVQRNVDVSW